MTPKKPGVGEVAPAHVLQETHGLYAANRMPVLIDPSEVPEHLRDLVPLAERWGIGDDIIRSDALKIASAAEKSALLTTIDERRRKDLKAWIETCGEAEHWSETIRAFFYLWKAVYEAKPVTRAWCSAAGCEARTDVADAPALGWRTPPWICSQCFADPAKLETWEDEWHVPTMQRLGRACAADHASCVVRIEDERASR